MKPQNWDSMTKRQRDQYAKELATSPRGVYLISQALHHAIEHMKTTVPEEFQEVSNIQDMEVLRDHVFTLFTPIAT